MSLAFFVDGSYDKFSETGGYGVVWNRYATGATLESERVGKGVAVAGFGLDNNICELLAIIEALQLMRAEFTRMMAARGRQHGEDDAEATGTIFSDSQANIQIMQQRVCAQPLLRKLVESCIEAAHELQTIPGLTVALELRWVPGHSPLGLLVPSHHWADRLGARGRKLQESGVYRPATGEGEPEQALEAVDPGETFWVRFLKRVWLVEHADKVVEMEAEAWEVVRPRKAGGRRA